MTHEYADYPPTELRARTVAQQLLHTGHGRDVEGAGTPSKDTGRGGQSNLFSGTGTPRTFIFMRSTVRRRACVRASRVCAYTCIGLVGVWGRKRTGCGGASKGRQRDALPAPMWNITCTHLLRLQPFLVVAVGRGGVLQASLSKLSMEATS